MVIKHFFVCIFVLILCSKTCFGQRRIVNGTEVRIQGKDYPPPRYMAYLVPSEQSVHTYQGWTCGGAIISPQHILTAAACVMDVDHLYAIVGYNIYRGAEALNDDPCTRKRKKRVIKTCAPKSYNVHANGWTTHDIGVAMLESPLDFTDATYKIDCAYPPALIKVNFNPQFEKVNTDVVTMGWGHKKRWRMPHHLQDHNQKYLHDSSLLIVDRDVCLKKVNTDQKIQHFLDIDIICVQGGGNIDVHGNVINNGNLLHGCKGNETAYIDETTETPNTNETKPNETKPNETENNANGTKPNKIDDKSNATSRTYLKNGAQPVAQPFEDHYDEDGAYDDLFRRSDNCDDFPFYTRRNGICQNDHGGPLVAWMGINPILIGIASTNLYDKDFNCVTPNLFTSTAHNEWFIKCAIKDDPAIVRLCHEMELRDGITTNEMTSNWIGSQVEPNFNIPNTFGSYQHNIQALQNIPHLINTQPFNYQQYLPNEPQNIPAQSNSPLQPQYIPFRHNIPKNPSPNILVSQNVLPQSNLPIQPELIPSHNNIPKIPNRPQNDPNMNTLRKNLHNIPNTQISQNTPRHLNLPVQQYIPSLQNIPEISIRPQNDPNMNNPRQNIQQSPYIIVLQNIPPQSILPIQPELIPSHNNIPKIPNRPQNHPNMNILQQNVQNIPNTRISQNTPHHSNLPLQQNIPSRQNIPKIPIRPQNDQNMNNPRQNIQDRPNILVSQNIPPQSNLPIQPELIPSHKNIPKMQIRPQYDTSMDILRQNVQNNPNIVIARPIFPIQHPNRPNTPEQNQNIPMEQQQTVLNQRPKLETLRLRPQNNLGQVYRSEMLTARPTAKKALLARATVAALRNRNPDLPERVQYHRIQWNRRNEKQVSGNSQGTSTVTSDSRSNKTETKL